MRRKDDKGLFAGVRELIDKILGVDNYTTKTAAIKLTTEGFGPDTATLVPVLFNRLDDNWTSMRPTPCTSRNNFCWRGYNDEDIIGKNNKSPEVTLERALIKALGSASEWSYQISLISGIPYPHSNRRRAIDLVMRQEVDSFEFIELKVRNDTPVFAAIEILTYGLLWLLSRRDQQCLGYPPNLPILNAKSLQLSVLAPRDYYYPRYSMGSFGPLAVAINDGLCKLAECTRQGVSMKFRFQAFPSDFTWPADGAKRPCDKDLVGYLNSRENI